MAIEGNVGPAWNRLLESTKPGTWFRDHPDTPGAWHDAWEMLSQEWVVARYRLVQNTPSETVTAWDFFEAAPQMAVTAEEAIAKFKLASNLDGRFIALPLEQWRPLP